MAYQELFDNTAKEIRNECNDSNIDELASLFCDYFKEQKVDPLADSIFIDNNDSTCKTELMNFEHDCSRALTFLEIGKHVTVVSNTERLIFRAKSMSPEYDSSVVMPYSRDYSSPVQDIVIDDVFLNDINNNEIFSNYQNFNDFSVLNNTNSQQVGLSRD